MLLALPCTLVQVVGEDNEEPKLFGFSWPCPLCVAFEESAAKCSMHIERRELYPQAEGIFAQPSL
ncbi:MAG: hypothetical protein CEE40_00690 [Chloroflexi bacterium B3_Chlor]|nr:MAG: hypothetical protein CEE40_00690 [Chloroflexi bacterium B3_Chlor]